MGIHMQLLPAASQRGNYSQAWLHSLATTCPLPPAGSSTGSTGSGGAAGSCPLWPDPHSATGGGTGGTGGTTRKEVMAYLPNSFIGSWMWRGKEGMWMRLKDQPERKQVGSVVMDAHL